MRTPPICIDENKGADQLRSNCEADQHLCFRYMVSTIPVLPKTTVTHQSISQMSAGRVDKNVKFNIRQEHVGDTLGACSTRVLYAWCTLTYVAVSCCALQARLGSKIF